MVRSWAHVVAWAGVLVLTAGCGPDNGTENPEPRRSGEAVELMDLNAAVVSDGAVVEIPSEAARVSVVAAGGGQVGAEPGSSDDRALVFPTEAQTVGGQRAALWVVPNEGDDPFTPGDRDFGFGADVLLPAIPGPDDGDNVMQRGLFSDVGQFKLQVDAGRPSCRVAGEDGEVIVKAEQPLDVNRWYRLWCERSEDQVDLWVGRLGSSGSVDWQKVSEPGETGDIPPGTPQASLSVGAKLGPEGAVVVDSPDQFNGLLEHVVFALDD